MYYTTDNFNTDNNIFIPDEIITRLHRYENYILMLSINKNNLHSNNTYDDTYDDISYDNTFDYVYTYANSFRDDDD